jgi:hypothetical protein
MRSPNSLLSAVFTCVCACVCMTEAMAPRNTSAGSSLATCSNNCAHILETDGHTWMRGSCIWRKWPVQTNTRITTTITVFKQSQKLYHKQRHVHIPLQQRSMNHNHSSVSYQPRTLRVPNGLSIKEPTVGRSSTPHTHTRAYIHTKLRTNHS